MIRKPMLLMAALTVTNPAYACGEIIPSKEITKIVQRLAYKDFPKASDIFSIIRVESSYNPKAHNENERESSNGLMQVQDGPMEPRLNIAMGVSLLREYFMLTHSREGAVKSYNIGPKNWLEGKFKLSAEAYYDKFLLQKRVYANYPKGKIVYLGKTLGCGKENGIPPELQARLAPKPEIKPVLEVSNKLSTKKTKEKTVKAKKGPPVNLVLPNKLGKKL